MSSNLTSHHRERKGICHPCVSRCSNVQPRVIEIWIFVYHSSQALFAVRRPFSEPTCSPSFYTHVSGLTDAETETLSCFVCRYVSFVESALYDATIRGFKPDSGHSMGYSGEHRGVADVQTLPSATTNFSTSQPASSPTSQSINVWCVARVRHAMVSSMGENMH